MPFHASMPARLFVFFSIIVGFLVVGFVQAPSSATSTLNLQYRTGDVSPTNSDIKPDLVLVNTGTIAIPLEELTIRYWYTRDSDQPQQYTCDYALLDCATITASFGTVNPPIAGADTYLELGFTDAAGVVSGERTTGIIQGRITKADWSDFNEADDYSYNAAQTNLADATTVTLYRNGMLVWGAEPGGMSTLALELQYRTGDVTPTNSDIKPELLIMNTGTTELALSDLTLRYWYTAGSNQPQQFWCDYADVDCANVTGTFGKVIPAFPGADTYLEIGFTAAAGALPGGGTSGLVKSRITNADWRDFDETDDYSYHATQTSWGGWSRATLYLNGVLVWGTEPGTCTGPYPPPDCPTFVPTPTSTSKPVATWRVALPLLSEAQSATVPLSPSDALYVEENWGPPLSQAEEDLWGPSADVFPGQEQAMVMINGEERSIAFARGYYLDVGTTDAYLDSIQQYIIIAFGSQKKVEGEWGVNLPRPAHGNRPDRWVLQVAQDFFDGYAANPDHKQPVIIGIGASNANYGWACDNGDGKGNNQVADPRYQEAGRVWSDLIAQVRPRRNTVRAGANDFEAWTELLPWSACGFGAHHWMLGFRAERTFIHINFGSNGYGELPEQWTPMDVYLVSNGYKKEVLPQVYCDSEVFVDKWIEVIDKTQYIEFIGVTSTNEIFRCIDGQDTSGLSWQDAWLVFDDALEDAGYADLLDSRIVSFFYNE